MDLARLAKGRAAFKPDKARDKPKPGKPAKTLEESAKDEIGEAEAAFRDRLAREDGRKVAATDSEFWFAVHFGSRQEKDAFLRRYGLARVGDKYLSGRAVDRVLQLRMGVNRDAHRQQ